MNAINGGPNDSLCYRTEAFPKHLDDISGERLILSLSCASFVPFKWERGIRRGFTQVGSLAMSCDTTLIDQCPWYKQLMTPMYSEFPRLTSIAIDFSHRAGLNDEVTRSPDLFATSLLGMADLTPTEDFRNAGDLRPDFKCSDWLNKFYGRAAGICEIQEKCRVHTAGRRNGWPLISAKWIKTPFGERALISRMCY